MVEAACSSCGVKVLVIPAAIRSEIREEMRTEVEAHVAGILTADGERLVIADEGGQFTCPVCGASNDAALLELG